MSEANGNPTLREQLARPRNRPAGEFALPMSGVTVYVRRFTLGDLKEFERLAADKTADGPDRVAAMGRLILCGPDNQPLFPAGDDGIYGVDLADIEAAVDEAARLNRVGREADAAGKRNSPGMTPSGSSSSSP